MKVDRNFAFTLVAIIATLLCFVSSQLEVTAITSDNSRTIMTMLDRKSRFRVRRQTSQKSRGLLSLLSDYISETRNETLRAFSQISDLVSMQIVPVQQGIQLNYTAPASSGELSDNVTTTKAPFILTQQEVLRIARRNLRGLSRLFNRESRKAIEASNENVRVLRKQFMEAVKPFVTSNSTTKSA